MNSHDMRDPQKDWDEFWAEICLKDGAIDIEQVKKELSDFRMLMKYVPEVYMHATGGMCSYATTLPSVVCGLIDDHINERCGEARNEQAGWVSVKDGLPEPGLCLVSSTWGVRPAYRRDPQWPGGCFQEAMTSTDEGDYGFDSFCTGPFRVTHWMPMPDAAEAS